MRYSVALILSSVALAGLLLGGCAETEKPAAIARPAQPAKPKLAYKVGNPYQIDGVWYYPTVDYNYDETGIASWYGPDFDGKDTPVTGNSPYGDAVAMTRIDPRTTQLANKQGGKPTVTQTIVVSSDGKTRTTTTKGTGANGQAIDTVAFYGRQ